LEELAPIDQEVNSLLP